MQNIYSYATKQGKRYYVKITKNKHQIIKRGFITKNEALVYLARVCESGKLKIKNNYIKDLTSTYLNFIRNSVKITTAYNKTLLLKKYIFPFFDNYKITQISNTDLELFSTKINKLNYSDKKRVFRLTIEFLKYLTNFGLEKTLNYSILSVPYNSEVHIDHYDYYTREEFESFLEVIDSNMYRLIFLLLFNYGLRLGELLGLRHKDFTVKRLFIVGAITNKTGEGHQRFITTKNKSSVRDYPMINVIWQAYKLYISELESYKPTDFVFKRSSRHLTIGPEPIRFAQKKYERLSGLRHIKIHEFRHSCATELINNGFQPDQVASWLGHSSSNVTTRIYAHLFPSRKMAIADYYNKQSNAPKKYQKSIKRVSNEYQNVSKKK